ncbi:zinc-dependent peptidase [Dubosiella newyorkensis]|jgi:hypothetical protein|uniref:zinc-dependent peptidase n=1 Tax=Dubosiella newyorkensis TaxID=1862672 RepID=UPI00235409D1|nr:zinc-dependent peptidase [Dubosiella newyorkensis]MCI9041674.1 zinc-dependent peptidase [Dubosiella newyorkensis]
MKRVVKAFFSFVSTFIVLYFGYDLLVWALMTYPFSWQEIEISRFLLHLLRMVDPLGIALVFACWNGIVTLFKLHVLSMVVLAVLLGVGISRYYEPLVSFMKGEYFSFLHQDALLSLEQGNQEYGQIFEREGYPSLVFMSDETISDEYVDSLIQDSLEKVPKEALNKVSAIRFMDEAYFRQEEITRQNPNVVGFANSADFSITILRNDRTEPYIDLSIPEKVMFPSDYYTDTLLHELGHIVDYQEPYSQHFLSENEDFQSLYDIEGSQLNAYGASSPAEFFAESYKYYLRYPDLMEEKIPLTQAYFASIEQ